MTGDSTIDDPLLVDCLTSGREQGFLGPMPVAAQIDHALGMAAALSVLPSEVVDLGSGGGVPSLVLACRRWPTAHWHLIEANARRVVFLNATLVTLGLEGRVEVHHQRAEEAARDDALRHRADLVVARSFGSPAVTAECAAPFLADGGLALISEPPDGLTAERWPAAGLAELGLVVHAAQASPVHVVTLRSTGWCSDRYPRRVGIPTKRPLF